MKRAIVTGATSGIGLETCRMLLSMGVSVIGVARSEKKVNQAQAYLSSCSTPETLKFVMGDLSSIQKVQALSDQLISSIHERFGGSFDLLIHVAGMVSSAYHENEDGNELTFQVNHLSVFQLSLALEPYLAKSKDPRMLVVSSKSHYKATINTNNPQSKRFYNIIKAYMRSKTYNVLFVKGFQERYPHILSFAIDPGLVNTDLGLKNTSKLASFVWSLRRKKGTDVHYPTQFLVDVATQENYKQYPGAYLLEGKPKDPNPITMDPHLIQWLWNYSEMLIQKKHAK